ncbi:MAG TPA: phosphoglucosamine mutase [Verrucomicrobiae bacterium]|nr:phosphoglucosamine mutase [Verrucomicrobiae bacterium]
MTKQLFGTDGIRGLPGEYPLDDATLDQIGIALGEYVVLHSQAGGTAPRVLLGRDTRESGPHIAARIASGISAAGAMPVSAGVLTTPGVAWLVSRESFAAGVVTSASHNPYHDNGVKLISPLGTKFPDVVEAEFEKSILSRTHRKPLAETSEQADHSFNLKLHEDYLAGLRQTVFPGANLDGMKIVLDCANGAASVLAPKLFRSLGAVILAMHDAPDGRNINAGCGSLHPEGMLRRVIDSGATLGAAFDGDADRAIFATSSGKLVNGDGVMLAAGRYLKATGGLRGNVIVGTTMANLGLERALEKSGLKLARTSVGDRYVLEEMQRIGANFGGEQSGHILFLDDAPTGDGMLTALKIASLVSIAGTLDELLADLKVFPQRIVNVRVKSKPPLEMLPAVASTLGDAERSLGNAGRVVVRYSGTEPLARVMVEAESEKDVERWTRTLAEALHSAIGC